jgi:6-phospho-beta-glucosidase
MAKSTIKKIAIIGGGSAYTPILIDGFIQVRDDLLIEEIVMYDIEPERLNIVGTMCRKQVDHAELPTNLRLTESREDAIEGAQFVCSQIRVGKNEARAIDESIPLKYGIFGQETTGPSGTLKAFRTIPASLDIARDVEKYAPEAFFLNFTNPSGIITEALLKHSNIKVIGLCDVPTHSILVIAEGLNLSPEEIFLDWVGLNHINWIRKVYCKGIDITDKVIQKVQEGTNQHLNARFPVDLELVKTLGILPNRYLEFYYHHDNWLKISKSNKKTRGEEVLELEKVLFKKYLDPKQIDKPEELDQRGGKLYSQAAIPLFISIVEDRRDVQILITQNKGTIPELPFDGTIEVPCVVGAHGVFPVHRSHLPKTIRPFCQQCKSWESWTVEAGVTGSKEAALMAMMENPLVPDFSTAKACLEEMLLAHKRYLPQFFDE